MACGCQFQVGARFGGFQFQRQRFRGGSRSVFDRKHQLAVMAAQVEKRIDPGIEIGAASQAVPGAAIGGDVLARMMDKSNRRAGLALQEPEIAQQRSDFAGGVFINGMKPDQRIENEKNRPVKQERGLEPLLIGGTVQTE